MEIDKETTIYELLQEDPELAPMLREIGLGCGGCPMAQLETIEMGALGHGMDPDKVIEELNKKRNEKKKGPVKKLNEKGLEVEN